ncbi:hypothetical protein BHM03_00014423 [Ensete ventricosum]|nr:hypothetical protein BHM03_00014423 [Ensete ventricosum]
MRERETTAAKEDNSCCIAMLEGLLWSLSSLIYRSLEQHLQDLGNHRFGCSGAMLHSSEATRVGLVHGGLMEQLRFAERQLLPLLPPRVCFHRSTAGEQGSASTKGERKRRLPLADVLLADEAREEERRLLDTNQAHSCDRCSSQRVVADFGRGVEDDGSKCFGWLQPSIARWGSSDSGGRGERGWQRRTRLWQRAWVAAIDRGGRLFPIGRGRWQCEAGN